MSKGPTTTTQQTSTELPSYAQPYVTDLLAKSQTAANQPYTPYTGQRVAGTTADTNQAYSMIEQQAAAGTPQITAAQTATQGITGYQPSTISTQGIPGADLSQYMNPYINNVLDNTNKLANQNFDEQQASRDASAVAAGAFGGDRRFVSDSLAQRDLNQQLNTNNAQGLAAAYDSATGLFTSDQNRSLTAQTANETAQQNAGQLQLNAANQLGQLAQTGNSIGLTNAAALSGAGSAQQAQSQAGLDQAYQDFTAQRDYPAQQAALYSQLLNGTYTPQTSTATTTPAPSLLSQLIGLGTAGVGLFA